PVNFLSDRLASLGTAIQFEKEREQGVKMHKHDVLAVAVCLYGYAIAAYAFPRRGVLVNPCKKPILRIITSGRQESDMNRIHEHTVGESRVGKLCCLGSDGTHESPLSRVLEKIDCARPDVVAELGSGSDSGEEIGRAHV